MIPVVEVCEAGFRDSQGVLGGLSSELNLVLWWCYGVVMVVLWWCYGGVMVVLWWCYGGVIVVL
jgi:hypothetical protein